MVDMRRTGSAPCSNACVLDLRVSDNDDVHDDRDDDALRGSTVERSTLCRTITRRRGRWRGDHRQFVWLFLSVVLVQ
jgi:hypothetical protein